MSATERLIGDLAAAVEGEKEKERVRIVEGKGTKGHAPGTSAALYGVSFPYLLSSLVLRTSTYRFSSLLKYLGRGKSTKQVHRGAISNGILGHALCELVPLCI